MSSEIFCPACGSHNLNKSEIEDSTQLTLGPDFSFKKEIYTCMDCEESGDFALKNDAVFLEAQKAAQCVSVKYVIDDLAEKNKLSMAYLERAFELPTRTITRWKNGDFSSSSLALMRTVKTYPFIAHVAAAGFDPLVAERYLVMAGLTAFKDRLHAEAGNYFSEQGDNFINHVFQIKTQSPATRQFVIGGN